MKSVTKYLITISLTVFMSTYTTAQISQGGIPRGKTMNLKLGAIEEALLPDINNKSLLKSAEKTYESTGFFQTGKIIKTNYDFSNSGEWMDLDDGGRLWVLKIRSETATGLTLYFDEFNLAPDSRLFVYSPDFKQIRGAFGANNNNDGGKYAINTVEGSVLIIEYYEPKKSRGLSQLKIGEVGHSFRTKNWHRSLNSKGFGDSDPCHKNINCALGDNYQDVKRAVGRIMVKDATIQGFCSGSLINNVRQDCHQYFLTADHCLGNASPEHYEQWIIFFNYESPSCANPTTEPNTDTVVGAKKIATAPLTEGGSDFLLIEATPPIPDSYKVYYAGWNNINAPVSEGANIHHPRSDIKKISTFNTTLNEASFGRSTTHWLVDYAEGGAEGGTSGSSLFNTQGQIIGIASYTIATGPTEVCGPMAQPFFYGKVSYSWGSHSPNQSNMRLKDWLDPDNTGATSLTGREACVTLSNGQEFKIAKQFEIYPNPNSGEFKIKSNITRKPITVVVLNATGQTLKTISIENKSAAIQNVNISNYSNGLYFIQITAKDHKETHKIVLNQ